jgi:LysM repeat protein
MSRKNTIVAAILINAIFLIVLFSLTVKSSAQDEKLAYPNVASLKDSVSKNQEMDMPPIQLENEKPLFTEKAQFLKELEQLEKSHTPAAPKPIEEKPSTLQHKPAPQAKKEEQEFVMVTVKKGDVLAKIAKANGTTVKEIMDLNHLKSTVLHIGQKLKIPKLKAALFQEDDHLEFYTIRPGDNLWIIASKHSLKLSDLKRLNQLDDEKAKKLKPGDQIRIK